MQDLCQSWLGIPACVMGCQFCLVLQRSVPCGSLSGTERNQAICSAVWSGCTFVGYCADHLDCNVSNVSCWMGRLGGIHLLHNTHWQSIASFIIKLSQQYVVHKGYFVDDRWSNKNSQTYNVVEYICDKTGLPAVTIPHVTSIKTVFFLNITLLFILNVNLSFLVIDDDHYKLVIEPYVILGQILIYFSITFSKKTPCHLAVCSIVP